MHTQGQAIKFLERVFGPAKISNGGSEASVVCPCPTCSSHGTDKRKLAIRTDNWLTHCWVCGYRAKTIYGLLRLYKPEYVEEFLGELNGAHLVSDAQDNAFTSDSGPILLPRGFQLLGLWLKRERKEVPVHIRYALRYLREERGLSDREIWYFKFGVTDSDEGYRNRIIVPSHDQNGDLNFFTARSFRYGTRPKYFNPPFRRETVIFNEINIDWEDELTIVEGPFDLAKVNDNATCLLGKELTVHCALFQAIVRHSTPVLVCLDADASRQALNVAKLLHSYGVAVRVASVPEQIGDPGNLPLGAFSALAEAAVEYNEMFHLRALIG